MKKWLLCLLCFLIMNPGWASEKTEFDKLYGELLVKYWRLTVMINNIETTVFAYADMQKQALPLFYEMTELLKHIDPESFGDSDEAKAFWINVYNFSAMKLVVEHYPVDSIRSFKISLIKHPWSKKSIQVGNQKYSLTEIEKEILLKTFRDPRIIFAVSCAAVSCPDRTDQPFRGKDINSQLDEVIKLFFKNRRKGLLLDKQEKRLTLSWILDKDAYLFEQYHGGVLGFVKRYVDVKNQAWLENNRVEFEFFPTIGR